MKVKLTTLPLHCLFPNAPVRFAHYVATVPVYDPEAFERTEKIVKQAMWLGVKAAVASEPKAKWRPRGLPKCVYLPVTTEHIVRRQNGCGGMKLVSRTRTPIRYRRFKIHDLATIPFQKVKSQAVPEVLSKRLRLLIEG